ncbi:response regulator transcription factor [Acidothermus cellulolyticus]|uniref:response regulator transcription factor n=1 Tax=Acidothermus cellulolyticus TaxID=28049 RepID=UPI00030551F8|nr:response regulator transcription factor [Acidothermus cellulolyticus]
MPLVAAMAAHDATASSGTSVRRCRVVVADDAAGMRALLATLLSIEPDFDVVGVARDGAEAVDLVLREQPDLLVIDITMPVMSGTEAIRRIREANPRVRVAVLSGERQPLPPGADAILVKGTVNEELIAVLRRLCRAGSQHDAPPPADC